MMTLEQHFEPKTVSCSANTSLFTEAERELAAFLSAVTEVHGPQCVTKATEHWMRALEDIYLPSLGSKECFRRVTFAAVASLCH